jgi:predicted SAM-dependent methyltransferase
MLKIDLCCGYRTPEGFIGVDKYNHEGVNIVADLNERFPFEDSTVDEIRAVDALEHLKNSIHTMN